MYLVVEYSHQLLIVVPLAVGTDHVSLELFYRFLFFVFCFFAPKVLNFADLHFLFFVFFGGFFFHISQQ